MRTASATPSSTLQFIARRDPTQGPHDAGRKPLLAPLRSAKPPSAPLQPPLLRRQAWRTTAKAPAALPPAFAPRQFSALLFLHASLARQLQALRHDRQAERQPASPAPQRRHPLRSSRPCLAGFAMQRCDGSLTTSENWPASRYASNKILSL